MKATRFLSLMAICAALTVSCEWFKPDNPDGPDVPGGEDEQVDEINGTKIEEGMTACGLVYDAKTKQGIPDVPVTDGYAYVKTDANGVYQMKANRYCRVVYLSVPAAYRIPLDEKNHQPWFYRSFDKSKGVDRNDFALEPQAVENNFTLIMIGDPQCQNDSQAERYKNETVPAMINTLNNAHSAGKYPNAYGVTLGDIVFDSTNMWDKMMGSMSNLKLADGSYFPIFQCIGNHDHNSLVKSNDYEATEKYVEMCGPTDYSFDRGKAHVIVMDDIMVTSVSSNSSPNKATWSYNAGFSKVQYNWLEADIANVENISDKVVFLCMHIPVRGGASSGGSTFNNNAYYADMLKLLKGFKEAHLMIGHTHYPQNYIHKGYKCAGGQPIYEHIHGAACGSWWSCDSNVTGAPNGYSVYEIEGNTVKNWVALGSKTSQTYQMRVYDGDQIYNGSKGYEYAWFRASNVGGSSNITAKGNAALKNAFVAEIWNDDDTNWTVEMWQNGAKIGDFKRLANGSCCNICISSYYFNELGKNTDTWVNKTASHYWYFVPASAKPASEKGWEVRATQTIPTSGVQNLYTCSTLTTDYSQF